MIDIVTKKLSEYQPSAIVTTITMIVLISTLPIVYIITLIFSEPYTPFLFITSIILPILLTPPVALTLLKASRHLKHVKEALDEEIQKNKKRDILLFEQARFVLMGEMMANISHQWKQPLNTIGLAVVAAKTSNGCEDDIEKYFEIMEDNVKHLASTIDDFMSFFDNKTYLELRSLDSIIKEMRSIIHTHISNKEIELVILNNNDYGEIEIASSISQVILNLLNNAKDAFENMKGTKRIKLQFVSKKNGLEIECCDNAKGISDDIKEKIFDPYFTTKPKSQGTGIGLHMSKEIVQKLFHGEINLSSREHSRSAADLADKSSSTCFYIAIPYSTNCVLKEESI